MAAAGKSLLLLVILGFTSPALAGFRQVAVGSKFHFAPKCVKSKKSQVLSCDDENAGAPWGSGLALQAASLLVKRAGSALTKVPFFDLNTFIAQTQFEPVGSALTKVPFSLRPMSHLVNQRGHCPHPHVDTDLWSVGL